MSLSLLPAGSPPLLAASPPGMADQVAMLRRHLRSILALGLAVTLLAAGFLAITPASYTATTVLLYDPAIPANAPPESSTDAQAELASQAAIITSLPELRALAAIPSLAQGLETGRFTWKFSRPTTPDDLINLTRRALAVTLPANTRLLEISFTSTSPILSAQAANLAATLYLTRQRDQSFADMQAQQSWLQARQADLQSDLDATTASLAAARSQAGQVAGMQGDLSAQTASRITAALVDAQAALAMATARLHSATTSDAAADAAIAPNLLPLRKEQADLAATVNALAQQYGTNYPDLTAARLSLAAIDGEINAETGREIAAARAEIAADQAEVNTLSASLDAARKRSEAQDAQSIPQQNLSAHEESDRAMLAAMAVQSGQLAQSASRARPPARQHHLRRLATFGTQPRASQRTDCRRPAPRALPWRHAGRHPGSFGYQLAPGR